MTTGVLVTGAVTGAVTEVVVVLEGSVGAGADAEVLEAEGAAKEPEIKSARDAASDEVTICINGLNCESI